MFGNGLRPQIWPEFTKRFNIPNIAEFYGSTEGNSNISKFIFRCVDGKINLPCLSVNYENRVGAVGFVSVLFPNLLPLGLIKINEETGQEIRDENG